MILLEGHHNRVRALAFAPDGLTLATGGADRMVRLWDLAAGAERATLAGHTRPVLGLAFGADGRRLASVQVPHDGVSPTVRIWDSQSGEPLDALLPILPGDDQALHAHLQAGGPSKANAAAWYCLLRVGPDQRYRLSASFHNEDSDEEDGLDEVEIRFRRDSLGPAVGQVPLEIPYRHRGQDRNLYFPSSRPGTHAGAFVAGHSFVRDFSNGVTAAFSPDDRTLALTDDRSILLLERGKPRPAELAGHRNLVRTLAFSPDGLTLASGGHDGIVRFWDVPGRRQRAEFDWGLGMIDSVAFSPDGMTAAAGGRTGLVVWDVEAGA